MVVLILLVVPRPYGMLRTFGASFVSGRVSYLQRGNAAARNSSEKSHAAKLKAARGTMIIHILESFTELAGRS